MTRVLIVDDSATMRTMLRSILESDPTLNIVGEARDGREGLKLCLSLQPDIVTTDIRMPRMDGFEMIEQMMAESPRPIVVITTTISDPESDTTFRATELGALSVLGKPRGMPGDDPAADRILAEVNAMASVTVVSRRRRSATRNAALPAAKKPAQKRRGASKELKAKIELIAVGASTGGPSALQSILRDLPDNIAAPILVVQHISTGFIDGMAKWLNNTVPPHVKIAEPYEQLKPGTVYLAPDDKHMIVKNDGLVSLSSADPVGGHKPSATVLFESVAEIYGASAVGIILTGMGRDGADGLKVLHDTGARVIAQDQDSCVIFGMPKEAIALGSTDEVIPLCSIASRIEELAGHSPELANTTVSAGRGGLSSLLKLRRKH